MAKYLKVLLGDSEKVLLYITDSMDVVKKASELHKTNPVASAAIGRLITGTKLMILSQKEDSARLSVSINGNGDIGKLIAFSDNYGTLKVKLDNPNPEMVINEKGKLDVGHAVGKEGFVSVTRDSDSIKPYTGQTKLISGEIAEDLTYYYADSEQQGCAFSLGVFINKEALVDKAGGMMIHVLPDCIEKDIDDIELALTGAKAFTEYLKAYDNLEDIIKEIFQNIHYKIIDSGEYDYQCDCSEWRAKRAYDSIEKSERDEIIKEDGNLTIHCDYCGKDYIYTR